MLVFVRIRRGQARSLVFRQFGKLENTVPILVELLDELGRIAWSASVSLALVLWWRGRLLDRSLLTLFRRGFADAVAAA
jgi:hypothetical protein